MADSLPNEDGYNKIVKLCHEELGEPMTIIINKSLASGTVPAKYKIAKIIPLYKKNEPNDFGNYRPVSLLSALSKIVEKVVCGRLMKFMTSHNPFVTTSTGSGIKVRQTMSSNIYDELRDRARCTKTASSGDFYIFIQGIQLPAI